MALSVSTDKQLNAFLTQKNQDSTKLWYQKPQTYITVLSVIATAFSIWQWQEKGMELLVANEQLDRLRQTNALELAIQQVKLQGIEVQAAQMTTLKDDAYAQLKVIQAQNLALSTQENETLIEIIRLMSTVGQTEAKIATIDLQLDDLKEEYEVLEEKEKETTETLIDLEKQINTYEKQLGIYAEYIQQSGLYTSSAIRDLVSLKYIKTPRKIAGNHVPFTKPYTISFFLTYPEFAQERLDKQILSVTYPMEGDVQLKNGKTLIVREKLSSGGLRFLGSYDGESVPSNPMAIIQFVTNNSEEQLILDGNFFQEVRLPPVATDVVPCTVAVASDVCQKQISIVM